MSIKSPSPHLTLSVPSPLPILPLPPRTILFPSLVISITINQSRPDSRRLIRDVLAAVDKDPRTKAPIVGLAPIREREGDEDENRKDELQVIRLPGTGKKDDEHGPLERDGENDKPDVNAIYDWGCAARIVRIEASHSGAFNLIVEGLARIRIDRFTQVGHPYYEAEVTVFSEQGLPKTATPLLQTLKDTTTTLLTSLSSLPSTSTALTHLPPTILRRLSSLLRTCTHSTAPLLADVLISTLCPPSSHSTKLNVLSTPSPEDRLKLVIDELVRLNEILDVGRKIGERVEGQVGRQQREWLLRSQLKAIKDELSELERKNGGPGAGASSGGAARGGKGGKGSMGEEEEDEEDELAELTRRIESHEFISPEALAVAKRELKRLKRIPPQSVEHGVVRTYLDTLVSLPWGRKGATLDLAAEEDMIGRARRLLDEDHYGLEKVKKRLIEFLAVVKLGKEKEERERKEIWDRSSSQVVDVAGSEGVLDEEAGEVGDINAQEKGDVGKTLVKLPSSSSDPSSDADADAGKDKKDKKDQSHSSDRRRLSPVPIILLVGPPGVGKTSIARSLAGAMGRKFHRIALGGVRDEAEIRGHRRTYVGAMPGLICQALRKVGCCDPVVLLDEVDKIANGGFHGDPGAALLEVLDGEQNWQFNDHYVNVPVDLSECLFVATANSLETISPPLLDRMEVIELSGYVTDEKLAIARRHLLPKQIRSNVLQPSHVSLSDEVLTKIITSYTLEAGVRSLEREIGSVCRSKAVEFASASAKHPPSSDEDRLLPPGYDPVVTLADLERILGPARFEEDLAEAEARAGVVTGLSVTGGIRGNIMRVEATSMAGSGEVKLTGQLGDVMKESAQIAMSWIRANAVDLGLAESEREKILEGVDLHVHFPAGSIPKDGPSGGVTLVTALVSLLRGLPVRPTLSMTGEITLRGLVTPIGGVREKSLAAHRAGCTTVLLPDKNRRDVDDDLRKSLGDEVEIVFVKTLWDVLGVAFGERLRKEGKGRVVWSARSGALESRL